MEIYVSTDSTIRDNFVNIILFFLIRFIFENRIKVSLRFETIHHSRVSPSIVYFWRFLIFHTCHIYMKTKNCRGKNHNINNFIKYLWSQGTRQFFWQMKQSLRNFFCSIVIKLICSVIYHYSSAKEEPRRKESQQLAIGWRSAFESARLEKLFR